MYKQGVVTYTWNLSTWERKAGRSGVKTSFNKRVWGQSELDETLPKNQSINKINKQQQKEFKRIMNQRCFSQHLPILHQMPHFSLGSERKTCAVHHANQPLHYCTLLPAVLLLYIQSFLIIKKCNSLRITNTFNIFLLSFLSMHKIYV